MSCHVCFVRIGTRNADFASLWALNQVMAVVEAVEVIVVALEVAEVEEIEVAAVAVATVVALEVAVVAIEAEAVTAVVVVAPLSFFVWELICQVSLCVCVRVCVRALFVFFCCTQTTKSLVLCIQ